MHHLVQMETTDGTILDGIIEDVDDEGVDLLEPAGDMDGDDNYDRQFGYGGYGGFGGYGFNPYIRFYPRRFRRFRRRRFPFPFIRRLFFPYFY